MKKSFFNWNLEIFVKSFKALKLDVVYLILLDILFFASLYLGFKVSQYFFLQSVNKLQAVQLELMAQSFEEAVKSLSLLTEFWNSFVLLLIISSIFFILSYSFFKGWIWHKVLNKKYTAKVFLKFFLLNLIWQGAWITILVLATQAVKEDLFYLFFLILFIFINYFSNLLYILFIRNYSFKNIFRVFSWGVKKLPYLLAPYIIILLILSLLFLFNLQLFFLHPAAKGAISILLFLIYLAWTRYYLSYIIQEIQEIYAKH